MKKLMMVVSVLALGAGVLMAQPQPGIGSFSSLITTGTTATSLTVGGGITAGTGAVAIVNTTGKIPALSSTYVADLSSSNLTMGFNAVTFSAGNFFGSGSMTWTVDSADISSNTYVSLGSAVWWNLAVTLSTVAGTRNAELRATLPGSFTAAQTTSGPCVTTEDNATAGPPAMWAVASGNTYASLYRDASAGTSWAAATNTLSIRCLVFFGK